MMHTSSLSAASSALSTFLDRRTIESEDRVLEPNAVLFDVGAAPTHLWQVRSGQVWIYQPGGNDARRLVGVAGPGQLVGLTSLAGFAAMGKRAVAQKRTAVRGFAVDAVLRELATDGATAVAVIREIAGHLHRSLAEHAAAVFHDLEPRLAHLIVSLGNSAAADREATTTTLWMSQRDLADALGASRESVNASLSKWQRQQLIETGRGRIIFDAVRLQQFVAETHPLTAAAAPTGCATAAS